VEQINGPLELAQRADVCGRASMALMRDGEQGAALGGIGLAKPMP
jgi:hypothetical protein